MKLTYKHTLFSTYIACITQAIVATLPPLLFATFNSRLGVSLELIGLIVSVNFVTQLLTDLVCVKVADRVGYRACAVAAHVFCAAGLVLLAVLPEWMPDPYIGILIATFVNAIGGGIIEVVNSPIVESLPGDEKARAMSLMHSFYCWGCVLVILLSTAYFLFCGTENWFWLPILWALIPFVNIFLFARVPLAVLVEDGERMPLSQLVKNKALWLFLMMMACAGASELSMSQWASMFAEVGLGVSKTLGDLLGPCAFAVTMGAGRLLYGIFGGRLNVAKWLAGLAGLCVAGYAVTVFAPWPALSLAGCAITGFSVALMWPGTISIASAHFPRGGTALFALCAFAGDVGCSVGPWAVGMVSGAVEKLGDAAAGWFFGSGATGAGIKLGLLCVMVFPAALCAAAYLVTRLWGKKKC